MHCIYRNWIYNNQLLQQKDINVCYYRKIPKFFDTKELRCNLPNIQTKRQNHGVICKKDANGIANSEDSDLPGSALFSPKDLGSIR